MSLLYSFTNGLLSERDEKDLEELVRRESIRRDAGSVRANALLAQRLDWYAATTLDRNYDGDSWKVTLDAGFGNVVEDVPIRLFGIDTPEISKGSAKSKQRGKEARDYVRGFVLGKTVVLRSHRVGEHGEVPTGKYGRYLFQVICQNPATGGWFNLGENLVETHRAAFKLYGSKPTGWFQLDGTTTPMPETEGFQS